MKIKSKFLIKIVGVICASLLFATVFYLPIKYYTFLRLIVFIGAVLVLITLRKKQLHWIAIFVIVAILFNPIFPIYLYIKVYWIPIDIISGILFLLVAFLKPFNKKVEVKKKKEKAYSRDKIY